MRFLGIATCQILFAEFFFKKRQPLTILFLKGSILWQVLGIPSRSSSGKIAFQEFTLSMSAHLSRGGGDYNLVNQAHKTWFQITYICICIISYTFPFSSSCPEFQHLESCLFVWQTLIPDLDLVEKLGKGIFNLLHTTFLRNNKNMNF